MLLRGPIELSLRTVIEKAYMCLPPLLHLQRRTNIEQGPEGQIHGKGFKPSLASAT